MGKGFDWWWEAWGKSILRGYPVRRGMEVERVLGGRNGSSLTEIQSVERDILGEQAGRADLHQASFNAVSRGFKDSLEVTGIL